MSGSSRIRRKAPSPFGTSFIDLLVGALAMVAMLWAANADNSGSRGAGEAEESSAMLVVEQYGVWHIRQMVIGQHGRWGCTVDISHTRSERPVQRCHSQRADYTLIEHSDGVRVQRQAGSALEIGWRLDVAPKAAFRETLEITVDHLTDLDVEAEIRIEPCCSHDEPHYVRTMAVSGAGHSERIILWHETGRLRAVLEGSPKALGWIEMLRSAVRDGTVVPHLVGFDAGTQKCYDLQGRDPAPALRVVFEPEGDVRITEPDSTVNAQVAAFVADYPRLLARYVNAP